MKKFITLSVFSLFLCLNSFSQSGWFKINETPKSPWRNPGSVAVTSLLLPGSGYFANDMMKEGFTFLGAEVILGGAGFYYMVIKPAGTKTNGFGVKVKDTTTNRRTGTIFLGAAGALHLFQFVHSTLITSKSNRINGYAKRPIKKTQMSLETAGVGLSFRLNF